MAGGIAALGLDGVFAVQERLALVGQHGEAGAKLREGGGGLILPLQDGGEGAVGLAGVGGVRGDLLIDGGDALGELSLFLRNLRLALAALLDLLIEGGDAVGLLGGLDAHAGDALGVRLHVGAENGGVRIERGGVLLGLRDFGSESFSLHVLRAHLLGAALGRGIAGKVLLRGSIVALDGLVLLREPVERLHPDGDLEILELRAEIEILARGLALAAEGLDLQLQLIDLVVDAQEVFLRALELALALLLAVAEAGDARRLLEDLAALAGLAGDDLGNAALTDDGITVAAEW